MLRNVVTMRASLSTSCLAIDPFFWLLLTAVWAHVGTVYVTRETEGSLFVLLVAALLFVGGYITFVSRYVNLICFTILIIALNSIII